MIEFLRRAVFGNCCRVPILCFGLETRTSRECFFKEKKYSSVRYLCTLGAWKHFFLKKLIDISEMRTQMSARYIGKSKLA